MNSDFHDPSVKPPVKRAYLSPDGTEWTVARSSGLGVGASSSGERPTPPLTGYWFTSSTGTRFTEVGFLEIVSNRGFAKLSQDHLATLFEQSKPRAAGGRP